MKKTTKTSDPNDLSFLQKLFSSPFNSQTKHHSNYTDQQNLLSKLLNIQHQNAVSYDELAKRAENAGKISVVFVGAFYVIGLFVFSSYYSSLHIRSIELFRAKYLFIGFYFTLFSLLLIAQTLFKSWKSKLIYISILTLTIILANDVNNRYISDQISRLFGQKPYFNFERNSFIVITYIILTIISIIGISILINILATRTRTFFRLQQRLFIILLLLAFFITYGTFVRDVFPNIPDALGGARPPIVWIEFSKDTPEVVKSNFDMGGKIEGYFSPFYLAQLIYTDSDSIFFKQVYWFSNEVYEIKRDQVLSLEYTDFNPAEMGSPYLRTP